MSYYATLSLDDLKSDLEKLDKMIHLAEMLTQEYIVGSYCPDDPHHEDCNLLDELKEAKSDLEKTIKYKEKHNI